MRIVLTVLLVLSATYAVLLAGLLVARPRDVALRDVARLLPDLVRLVSRLARDPQVPRRARAALWLLLGYLAAPLDLVPDVVPVVGYADDVIIVALTLRFVVRAAGAERLRTAWPGTPDGLRLVARLARAEIETPTPPL